MKKINVSDARRFQGTRVQKIGGGVYIIPAAAMHVTINGRWQHATPIVMLKDSCDDSIVMIWIVKNPFGSHNLAATAGNNVPFTIGNLNVAIYLNNLGCLDEVASFLTKKLATKLYRLLKEADEEEAIRRQANSLAMDQQPPLTIEFFEESLRLRKIYIFY